MNFEGKPKIGPEHFHEIREGNNEGVSESGKSVLHRMNGAWEKASLSFAAAMALATASESQAEISNENMDFDSKSQIEEVSSQSEKSEWIQPLSTDMSDEQLGLIFNDAPEEIATKRSSGVLVDDIEWHNDLVSRIDAFNELTLDMSDEELGDLLNLSTDEVFQMREEGALEEAVNFENWIRLEEAKAKSSRKKMDSIAQTASALGAAVDTQQEETAKEMKSAFEEMKEKEEAEARAKEEQAKKEKEQTEKMLEQIKTMSMDKLIALANGQETFEIEELDKDASTGEQMEQTINNATEAMNYMEIQGAILGEILRRSSERSSQ